MLLFSQFKPCFLAHLALKATFMLPWTQGHMKKILSQDKNAHLQTVRARLNHLTCISSLACQHKMQQQAGPFCQYNPFILSLTHHMPAVPVQVAYIGADILSDLNHTQL